VKSLSPFVVLAGMIGGALACGDSSGPGPRAASVTGIAGDNQVAPTGTALQFPLSLVVLGTSGQPLQGVSVDWTVTPGGGASFAPQPSTSDVNGNVSTTVTLGAIQGDIVVRANVPGVSPVVYHATAIDPCQFIKAYTVGETVTGNLTSTDCLAGGSFFYDLYDLNLSAPQSLRITMRWSGPPSTDTLDSYVELYRFDDGVRVGFDDDSILVEQQNSQLDIIVPADRYFIGASSFGPFDRGPYTLSSAVRPPAMSGCRQVWMMIGTSVADSVTASDCADSTASPRHYDVARILVPAGAIFTLAQRSMAMNPLMSLYLLNCDEYTRTLVASNDDSSGTSTDAFISYTAPSAPPNSCFDVLLSTSAAGETGAYTFAVATSAPPTPHTSAPAARGRDRWWRGISLPKRSKL